jgi:hypothetical protein
MAGLASGVAVALLLTGCGGGHHGTAQSSTVPGSSTVVPPPTSGAAATTTAPGGPTSIPSTSIPSTSSTAGSGCLTSQLRIGLGTSQGAAGSVFVPLVFTNTGPSPCTLSGYPGVSYVTGDAGQQVGQPASRSPGPVATVRLAPNGVASATLQMANSGNFPPEQCQPTAVRGLRVYPPGQTAAGFVALGAGAMACSGTLPGGQSQLFVRPVVAGANGSS